MVESFDRRLAANYGSLSNKLRQAADYVAANPVDTATRSLRSVARDSGLAPATFSRLARAIGYESFEELREVVRVSIGRRVNSFSERAERLQAEHGPGTAGFLGAHMAACLDNVRNLGLSLDPQQLEEVVERLHRARQVRLVGALGSTGIVEYLSYMANFFTDDWSMAGRTGASLGGSLAGMDERDALIVVTKPPFASRAIRAAELARRQGAYVVVITDTHACPALRHASSAFLVPTESPHFYSSYVATLFLVETIVGMLASRAGRAGKQRIADVEEINRRLEEVRDG